MTLDPFTIAAVLTLMSVVMSVALAATWLQGHAATGFGYVVAAQILMPIGLGGLMVNLVWPSLFTLMLGNTMVLMGAAMLPLGMRRLLGLQLASVKSLMAVTVISGIVGLALFSYLVDSINARIVLMSFWLALIFASAAWPMKGRKDTLVAAIFLWIFAVLMIFRGIYAWSQQVEATVFDSEAVFHALTFLSVSVLGLGIPFSAVLINASVQSQAVKAERKKAENRAETMSNFLARTSHELRTPLNCMIGQSELLLSAIEDAQQKSQIRSVNQGAETLLELVNDLLTYLQCKSGRFDLKLHAVDLRQVLGDIKTAFAPLTSKAGVVFETHVSNDLPTWVEMDELRLVQILNNLIGNAIKFTSGGKVMVNVTSTTEGGKDWISIEVADTGRGIAPQELASVFRPFKQLGNVGDQRKSGSGLGLAITQSLVELMGGDINVRSKVDIGTTVSFRMPQRIVNNVLKGSRSAAAQEPQHPWRNAHVLHIDDTSSNVELLQLQLDHLGCLASGTTSPIEALRMLQQDHFDLIFVDCQMPKVSGFEFARMVRKIPGPNKTVPILAITADGSKQVKKQATDNGIDSVLTKPVRLRGLQTALAAWVAKVHPDIDRDRERPEQQERAILGQVSDKVGLLKELELALRPPASAEDCSTIQRWADTAKLFGFGASLAFLETLIEKEPALSEGQIAMAMQLLRKDAEALASSYGLDYPPPV